MAFQFSVAVRNAAINSIEPAIGASPSLRIRTGAPPADCAAARTGTVLAVMALPADFFGSAADGTIDLAGSWTDTNADAAGVAGHFEIVQGATCHIQGTVTATDGGGDMELQNTNIAVGQAIVVTQFQLTAGGG